MIFENKILEIYRNKIFCRCDNDGTKYYFSPEDFEGLKSTPCAFTSSKGDILQGYFYSYDGAQTDRIVVFDHGMGGGHRAYMKEIEMLARHGYNVFSYDHTGCMQSQGKSCYGFSQSISDLNDCLTFLKGLPQLDGVKISVIGHSWGGLAVLNVGAFHPDISHIVSISAPVSTKIILKQFFNGLLGGYYKTAMKEEEKNNALTCHLDGADSLLKTNAKALIIHSLDDSTVKAKDNFFYLEEKLIGRENTQFLLESGKKHNPNYTQNAVKLLGSFLKDMARARKKKLLKTDEQKRAFVKSQNWNAITEQDLSVWQSIYNCLDS